MSATSATDVGAELADLRQEIAALASGMTTLVAAQEAQTELLRLLLAAATEGDGSDGDLAAALREISRVLTAQGMTLNAIRTALAGSSR